MKWRIKTFEMDNEANITQAVLILCPEGEPRKALLQHHKPAYSHPDDTITINGAAYTRDTPVWEEQMRAWIKGQNQVIKTFDNEEDYIPFAKTVIALEE